MAIFTNQATLSFNGGSVNSNVVTGELVQVLTGAKTAAGDEYRAGENVTYVVSLVNTGATALTGLTLTDNLGQYTFDTGTLYPLGYVDGSVLYYQNGVVQPAPVVTAGPPLTITGIAVPAGGDAAIVYQARVNQFAPLEQGSTIVNTATVTGGGLAEPLILAETVTVADGYDLSITKSLTPAVVSDNGTLTYTFRIENRGNTPAIATDNVVLTDTFDPVLNPITVTYEGASWTEGVNYTYNTATGAFATLPGQITVPAATYTQNPDGSYTLTPGVATLTVTGTV